mmetsp:Transcript_19291/g.39082  ORF Transcript_19291/g.39082 Transcript_19291/m.39082 type:complete len:371 (+) Transcript_19291:215-1327(+)
MFVAASCRHRIVTNIMTQTTRRTVASLPKTFQAWRVNQQEDGTFLGSEQTLQTATDLASFAEGVETVTIQVSHSSLNFKDALSASGHKGVTRNFPHTPGIDAAGYVVDSDDDDDDDKKPVLLTGYDLGMNTDGGFGELIRVPKNWVVDMPEPWTQNLRTPMIYGTAGLTAALMVNKLVQRGEAVAGQTVAVTGATGAVGSVAVELLSRLGYHVVAISGKASTVEHLKTLGAHEVLGREEVLETSKKPLLKPRFDHAIDTVGGAPLVELLKQIKPDGSVACCGNAAGIGLPDATVLPFILRGVQLLGVDSVEIDVALKTAMWQKLAHEWACPVTEANAVDIGRHQLKEYLDKFLTGQSSGKVVLDHSMTKT